MKDIIINNQIRAKEVRVIDETGKQLGVMELDLAIQEAKSRNLDLVQITDKVEPPVCKITDYGKYIYQQQKKEKSHNKTKGGETKGIRLTFKISDHDLEIRAQQAKKFLKEGDTVRIEMKLRGREMALQSFAREKITKFLKIIDSVIPIKAEKDLKKEGNKLLMIISKK